MIESIYYNANIALNYIEGPKNGDPILLVHGNLSRWQAFSPIIPDLIEGMHVYALDLRGHGKSTHHPGTYTLQNHVVDIAAFIKEKIGQPVTLFGKSLGGMVGFMAAANHPELIRRIIVADSPLTLETLRPHVAAQREFAYRILHFLRSNQIKEMYKEVNDDFSSESFSVCDPDLIVATFDRFEENINEYDIKKLFPLIHCPVLIMRGEEKLGSMITNADIDVAVKLLPQLKHYQIPGVGHSLLDNKEIVLEKLKHFLQSNS
jgi:pimeloyl-ACP methyl ester carboxylesterase